MIESFESFEEAIELSLFWYNNSMFEFHWPGLRVIENGL